MHSKTVQVAEQAKGRLTFAMALTVLASSPTACTEGVAGRRRRFGKWSFLARLRLAATELDRYSAARTDRFPEGDIVKSSCRLLGGGAVILVALATAGCEPAGRMNLLQPRLAGWQRDLRLETDHAHWAGAGTQGIERILVEFPLPGARTGRPTYVLYLRLPAGTETVKIGPEGSPLAVGFLIQTRGEYAGLARVTGGTVVVRGDSQAAGARRTLELDLSFEDGSRSVGQLIATRDEYAVSRFEQKDRPADVAALVAQTGKTASQPEP